MGHKQRRKGKETAAPVSSSTLSASAAQQSGFGVAGSSAVVPDVPVATAAALDHASVPASPATDQGSVQHAVCQPVSLQPAANLITSTTATAHLAQPAGAAQTVGLSTVGLGWLTDPCKVTRQEQYPWECC